MLLQKAPQALPMAPAGLIRPVATEGEELPRVGFDVRLGKKFSSVDFDTERYADYLRSRGLNASEVALAHLEVTPPNRRKLQDAEYDFVHNRMRVGVTSKSKVGDANEVVYHETEHFIDALDGRLLGPVDRACKEVGMAGRLSSVASFIFGAHALVAQDMAVRSQELHNTLTAVQLSLLCTLGTVALSILDPAERRATEVQKLPAQQLIDFTVKSY